MGIRQGDDIYLFNFNTGMVHGPLLAVSNADCHDPTAWGGTFPVQIRVCRTPFTRRADVQRPNAPAFLRKKRPTGDLGKAATELFSWLKQVGTPIPT